MRGRATMRVAMPDDVTRFLTRMGAGEGPTPELMESLYAELHAMADRLMRGERGDHTLNPTALVHEAFLRLVDAEQAGARGRLYFLDAAAVTMRRVLVDHARRVGSGKRGGSWRRVTLGGMESDDPSANVDLLALHDALEQLEELDPRQVKLVELRFFAGMTGQEIADHQGLSRTTVVRELALARAWLRREMAAEEE